MKQVVQHLKTGKTMIEEVPAPAHHARGVLVRNAYSLVSAGTERMLLELAGGNLMEKARKRPDLVRQVLDKVKTEGLRSTYEKVMNKLETPVPLGYSSAGVVLETGGDNDAFRTGDRVACAGMGYASHAEEIFVPYNLCAKIPENVSLKSAAFGTMGAIALQGVRIAQAHLGDLALVIGLGLVGQLTAQILRAAGCRVIGFDIDPWKVDRAHTHGIDAVSVPSAILGVPSLAGPRWRGFDAVIITAATESNAPIEMAGEWARDKGVVVVVGAVKMDVPRKIYYEKELELRLSRSYGPGRYDAQYEERGIDYPYGYVRWTEQRNLEAFLDLLSNDRVKVDGLITHTFPIDDALRAYDVITAKQPSPYLGILLEYPDLTMLPAAPERPTRPAPAVAEARPARRGAPSYTHSEPSLSIGFIGAGNFARSVLLPHLCRLPTARLLNVAAGTGLSAKMTAQKFSFVRHTTDYQQILSDPEIRAVFIATRHHMHAPLVIRALQQGRCVFVEKPLCLNETELQQIEQAYRAAHAPFLMVGFNRRFSPFADEMRSFFLGCHEPMVIQYRVNAGALPPDSWIQSADEGGGRIVGEVCHFVDFMSFVTGSAPASVFAQALPGRVASQDNVVVTVTFQNGSIGALNYLANGDRSVPKERVEVFCEGSVAQLEDFRRLTLVRHGKAKTRKRFSQDKGHGQEMKAFIDAAVRGLPAPIPFTALALTTRATFKILDSLRTGQPVVVTPRNP